MTAKEGLNRVIDKIDEMRDFLKIGDEVIPFLSDLFGFMQDIMPLMKEANCSLSDGSRKLPDATDRIRDVDQTTEMATHEILDRLDTISEKLNQLDDHLGKKEKQTVVDVQDEVNKIIYALQFQDITAQKLEHADRILTAIYKKFQELAESTKKVKMRTNVGKKMMQEITDSIHETDMQKRSEDLDKETEDKIRQSNISQDDIDKLFE